MALHWPQPIFPIFKDAASHIDRVQVLSGFVTTLRRTRRSGARVLRIAKDLEPHEMTGWRIRLLWRLTLQVLAHFATCFVTFSLTTPEPVRRAVPGLARNPAPRPWYPAYGRVRLAPRNGRRRAPRLANQVAACDLYMLLYRRWTCPEKVESANRGTRRCPVGNGNRPTPEFRREAVRQALTSGRTRREIAEDPGIGLSTLTRWLSQERDAGKPSEAPVDRNRPFVAACPSCVR